MGQPVYGPGVETYHVNEESRRVTEAAAAIAVGVLSLVLANKMLDIGTDAINKEYDIRDRIFEVQTKYINHWTDVEVPQKKAVCAEIFGLSAPSADYTGALNYVKQQGQDLQQGTETGIDVLNVKNRTDCGQRGCTNDAAMSAPLAIAQASHYIYRHQERRRYDLDSTYRELASSTFRALETKPDQVFALLGNAASLYGTIGQSAMNMASSAASSGSTMLSFGLGSL